MFDVSPSGASARTPRDSVEAMPPHHWRSPGADEQARSIRHPVATVEVVNVSSDDHLCDHSLGDGLAADGCSSIELTPLLDSFLNRSESSNISNSSGLGGGDIELGAIGGVEDTDTSSSERAGSGTDSGRNIMLAVVQQPNKDIYVGYSLVSGK